MCTGGHHIQPKSGYWRGSPYFKTCVSNGTRSDLFYQRPHLSIMSLPGDQKECKGGSLVTSQPPDLTPNSSSTAKIYRCPGGNRAVCIEPCKHVLCACSARVHTHSSKGACICAHAGLPLDTGPHLSSRHAGLQICGSQAEFCKTVQYGRIFVLVCMRANMYVCMQTCACGSAVLKCQWPHDGMR